MSSSPATEFAAPNDKKEPWMDDFNRLRKTVSSAQFAIHEAYNQGVWDTLKALHTRSTTRTITEVQRYNIKGGETSGAHSLLPCPDGKWVKADDVNAIIESLPRWEVVQRESEEYSRVLEHVQTHSGDTKAVYVFTDKGAMFKLRLPPLPNAMESGR